MKAIFQNFVSKNRVPLLGLLVTAIGILILHRPSESTAPTTFEPIHTSIPLGQRLMPIEIINSKSLGTLLGSHGVVDLYVPDVKHAEGARLIAEKVKIIRAPGDASQYGVLIAENSNSPLLQHTGPFYVSVRNPKDIVKSESKVKRRFLIIQE